MTAEAELSKAPAWGLVLPASWWRIPLHPESERQRSIDLLLQMQTENTQLEAEVKEYLSSTLEVRARMAAATSDLLAISLQVVEGLPLSGSLLVSVLPSPGGPEHILVDLLAAHPRDRTIRVDLYNAGPAIRRRSSEPITEQNQHIDMHTVQFYVPHPTRLLMLHLVFSTPLSGEAGAAMENLFDAIADTLEWLDA